MFTNKNIIIHLQEIMVTNDKSMIVDSQLMKNWKLLQVSCNQNTGQSQLWI